MNFKERLQNLNFQITIIQVSNESRRLYLFQGTEIALGAQAKENSFPGWWLSTPNYLSLKNYFHFWISLPF